MGCMGGIDEGGGSTATLGVVVPQTISDRHREDTRQSSEFHSLFFLFHLSHYPGSMLGGICWNFSLTAMFSGRHAIKKNEEGRVFIDRDGKYFEYFLATANGLVQSIFHLGQVQVIPLPSALELQSKFLRPNNNRKTNKNQSTTTFF